MPEIELSLKVMARILSWEPVKILVPHNLNTTLRIWLKTRYKLMKMTKMTMASRMSTFTTKTMLSNSTATKA